MTHKKYEYHEHYHQVFYLERYLMMLGLGKNFAVLKLDIRKYLTNLGIEEG